MSNLDLGATVKLPTGTVKIKDFITIFATLPYQVDLIDPDGNYQWFSPNPWRKMQHNQGQLGQSFLNHFPERMVPLVQQILMLLESGQRDVIESPQIIAGHRVLVRYYAVRDDDKYCGALRVAEAVDHICQLNADDTFHQGIVNGKIITPPVTGIMDASTGASQADASTGASSHD